MEQHTESTQQTKAIAGQEKHEIPELTGQTESQAPKISKEMTVGDLVAKYPETVEVMLSHGLHCVGCHFNPLDTIESGCRIHGISEHEMLSMLDEINEVIASKKAPSATPENAPLVEITPVAAKKLAVMMQSEGKDESLLRVALAAGGCACHSYYMEFEESPAESDLVQKTAGISVLVARELQDKVRGTIIDYHESLNSSGFVMRNPNAKQACGCGKSISA